MIPQANGLHGRSFRIGDAFSHSFFLSLFLVGRSRQ
jgi:hypothetical protein